MLSKTFDFLTGQPSFSAEDIEIFEEAKKQKIHRTVHAGETSRPEMIFQVNIESYFSFVPIAITPWIAMLDFRFELNVLLHT